MDFERMIQACASVDADMVPEEGFPTPFAAQQEEALLDIGGEQLLKLARLRVAMMKHAPPVQFPPKEQLEKERLRLRRALAKLSPETRLLIRVLHGINARYYGFGGDLPEKFDVVRYLEALLEVRYARSKGDALRQQIIMETALIFRATDLEMTDSLAGDLVEYLRIVCAALGVNYDVRQLARDVRDRFG